MISGHPLTGTMPLGPQGLRPAVWMRRGLLRDRQEWQRRRVCSTKRKAGSAFADFDSFVEFETAPDLRTAVDKLDQREFKGQRVTCVANVGFPALSRWLIRSPFLDPTRHPAR